MCHNDQVKLIQTQKEQIKKNLDFSMKLVNKAVEATDLLKKFQQDMPQVQSTEVQSVISDIKDFQSSLQQEFIKKNPVLPSSLRTLKEGESAELSSTYFNYSHNFENQCSNILEMEQRYEQPLKPR
mmetsp:Transcript_2586/g.4007  ORF Transcript_2586/g.4007 Transcript_2586/m.4007 type:complete len:126 (-) Transcript_2586:555-932(-)